VMGSANVIPARRQSRHVGSEFIQAQREFAAKPIRYSLAKGALKQFVVGGLRGYEATGTSRRMAGAIEKPIKIM
jgi:hypothetical protein